ncbi:YqzL-like protein [Ruminococcaceae bacterium BL-6]|nr:YqzL-like protein [Ruminococcaceae bacterium BL-6]
MDEKQAWNEFRDTGSVQAYLQYARLTQTTDQPAQETVHANQYRGFDPDGEKRGGERPARHGADPG